MDIVGIGNALMDVVAFVDENFAPALGFLNDAVVHLERRDLDKALALLAGAAMTAGGGAANTMRAAAYLGARAAFVGRVGDDEYGRRYREELASAGVECLVSASGAPTGVFCSLNRPGGGRTLLVAPGAALDLALDPPPAEAFREGAILYLEGFLLRDRAYFLECLRRAREASMDVALDLGSPSLVQAERDFLLEIVPEYCDLVFANEDEFLALADLPMNEGLDMLTSWDIALVVKRAERGAIWAGRGTVIESPVRAVVPIDSTGAGDAFAAGFLVGRSRGLSPERCLRLGNRVAEEVLRVPGLGIDPQRLRRVMRPMLK